jgi:DNA-formamidopyrimidine glycosylase
VVRWANALRALAKEPLVSVELPERYRGMTDRIVGQHIREVETRGKHLLLHLSIGLTILCHAMMYGAWQIGKPGMALRQPARFVRLRLRTAAHEAVFFHGPVVDLLTPEQLATHRRLTALGPDLLKADFNFEEAHRRVLAAGRREIGDVLLDQQVVAGIGNIFKSEGLYLGHIDPRRPAHSISREEADRLWQAVRPMLLEAAQGQDPVTTLPPDLRRTGENYWVYSRAQRPCFLCGSLVAMVRQGQLERASYFCPNCQA